MRSCHVAVAAVCVCFVLGVTAVAQQGVTLVPEANGRVNLMQGTVKLGTIELGLHNTDWVSASQTQAAGVAKSTPDEGEGIVYTGSLAVPGGGSVDFTETIRPAEGGVFVDYALTVPEEVVLNGLGVSLMLPDAGYKGSGIEVDAGGDTPRTVAFAVEQPENHVLYEGRANQVGVVPVQGPTFAIGAGEGKNLLVNDLRRWVAFYEVRFPLIYAQNGQTVAAGMQYTVPLALGFDVPVAIQGLAAPVEEAAPAAATGA